MWKIRLPGDKEILINETEAKWVKDQLKNPMGDEYVEIGGQAIKRNQITAVLEADTQPDWNRKAQERADMAFQWKEEQGRLMLQTPEEKAEREIECKVKIYYFCRNSSFDIPKDLRERIKAKLVQYFLKNPSEAWALDGVYEDLMPSNLKDQGAKPKFYSVGDIIKQKRIA